MWERGREIDNKIRNIFEAKCKITKELERMTCAYTYGGTEQKYTVSREQADKIAGVSLKECGNRHSDIDNLLINVEYKYKNDLDDSNENSCNDVEE